MKKQFMLCASCRIIGLERGELLFVTKTENMCNACGTIHVPAKPVEVSVEVRDQSERVTVYVSYSRIDPSTETLREELSGSDFMSDLTDTKKETL